MDCPEGASLSCSLPTLVAHADWSTSNNKRWVACAMMGSEGRYKASSPEFVGEADSFLLRLREKAGLGGTILAGFDFPIGIPLHYAGLCGVEYFLEWLLQLGEGEWVDFYKVAEIKHQISFHRPFYPQRTGSARQSHLLQALYASSMDQLRRKCELPHAGRRAASPLFWTLGGQQVGKAALSGWREVIVPAITSLESLLVSVKAGVVVWPFSGVLEDLLQPGNIILDETYPAEFYAHLGVSFNVPGSGAGGTHVRKGKRSQSSRTANFETLSAWANLAGVILEPGLEETMRNGFGNASWGEDAFDAVIGLFGMLNVVLGFRPAGSPLDEKIRNVEGWIFGQ